MSDSKSSEKEEKSEQSTSTKLLERMNNDEFREYMPYMDLNELIFTEIYKDKWKKLFEIITKTKTILCYACNEKFNPDDIRKHINSTSHKDNLNKAAQFYHPGYTYFRGARSLMRGKQVSGRDLKQAIELANGGLTKLAHDLATKDVELFLKPDLEKAIKNPEFEKTLQTLVLSTTPKSPDVVYAYAHLPLPAMLSVEFSCEENIWKPMITCEDEEPLVSSTFTCVLCDATLRRVGLLNAHLSGSPHLTKQFTTLGVRCPEHDFLTKNCVFRNNTTYSFYINKAGQIYYKKKVDEILREKNGGEEEELATLNIKIRAKAEALRGQIREHELKEEENSEANKDNLKDGMDNSGLMGVEYVVRIIPTPFTNKMDYECTLCDIVCKETNMAEHLVSQPHRQKYMELHYPDTMTRYNTLIGHMKYFNFIRVVSLVLSKVALKLEKYHGYGAIRDVPQSLYNRNRAIILAEIRNQPHASQEHGPSFSNVVSKDEIRDFIRNPELSVSINMVYSKPERFTKSSPKDYKLCVGPSEDDPFRSERNGSRRSRSPRNRSTSRKRSHSGSPPRNRRSSPPSSRDIWKRYRHEVSISAIEIENKYNEYRRQPETHPKYNQEWNNFWKQRKLDLIAQGIEHQGYNYQPEWVNFFQRRIEVFFGEALQNAQMETRRRLNIPLDAEEDTPLEVSKRGEKYRRSDVNGAAEWSGPSIVFDNGRADSHAAPPIQPLVDNKPNVIHVLRLLSALEDHLGSLGQKVMDLLSKALSLEKHFGDNYMALESKVLNAESCTLIETAVEKLKGVIFAGLCDSNKEQSFQRVVQAAQNILKHADTRGYRNVSSISNNSAAGSRNDSGNTGRGNANGRDLQQLLSAIKAQGFNNPQGNNSLSNTLMALIGGSDGVGRTGQGSQRVQNRNNFGGGGGGGMPKRGGGSGGGGGNMGNQVRRDLSFNSNENWRGFGNNQQKPNPQQYRWTGPNHQQRQQQQQQKHWPEFNQRNGGGGAGGSNRI